LVTHLTATVARREQAKGLLDSLNLTSDEPNWKPELLQKLHEWCSAHEKDYKTDGQLEFIAKNDLFEALRRASGWPRIDLTALSVLSFSGTSTSSDFFACHQPIDWNLAKGAKAHRLAAWALASEALCRPTPSSISDDELAAIAMNGTSVNAQAH
jgi:hypothetical protein